MVSGGLVVGYMYVEGMKPLGHWPPFWGILLSGVVFVVVSLVTKPPRDTDHFLSTVEGFVRDRFWS
jgi:SSS family solute:Na+ symporter